MREFFGLFLLGIAALFLVFEVIALVDPVGTKRADDADPYGNPYRPWWVHALWFAVITLIGGAGVRLLRGGRRRGDRAG